MKGFVYVLKCSNGKYYTGSTTNLEKRLWQHQNGEGSNFTKAHLPVELVYVEEFERIDDAFYREKQIQGWSRKKKEALIAKDFSPKALSECISEVLSDPNLKENLVKNINLTKFIPQNIISQWSELIGKLKGK